MEDFLISGVEKGVPVAKLIINLTKFNFLQNIVAFDYRIKMFTHYFKNKMF